MPSPAQEKKVQISFTNWVLGGSLLVITDENGRQHSRRRRVMMVTGDVEAVSHLASSLFLSPSLTSSMLEDILIQIQGQERQFIDY
jgi:hypothetical protein